ncbi:MAG: bifunctional 5,10-methylenetetrahydrofolate dehydrogenase/5,10-methenyltetrahydrofolate cyclohydrolase [bacterium]|nr:bifunctional 5,10-methylenetetrahydrofolate dehydrogenase/5,10-methenyltetrahydrofolate cyclohydrolase [bacterium]
MIIDGKKIAEEIKIALKEEISGSGAKLTMDIIQVGDDAVSAKFVGRKEIFAGEIGVETKLRNFPESISGEDLRREIKKICGAGGGGGIIVQLPLPSHINTQDVLNVIPAEKDVDVLSAAAFGRFATGGDILPPVIGAVKEILDRSGFEIKGKNAAVIGAGILVGKPAAVWLINEGASVFVARSRTEDIAEYTREADIIISGAGKPNLITTEMVKGGAAVIDAGTAFKDGKPACPAGRLAGDVHPEVAEKASIFTPVPGGVGPLTVAMVFRNLVELNKIHPRICKKTENGVR